MRGEDEFESTELGSALRGLRDGPPAPESAMQRVSNRLMKSIAAGAAVAALDTAVASSESSAADSVPFAETKGAAAQLFAWLGKKATLTHLVLLVGGGVVGASIDEIARSSPVRVLYVDRVQSLPSETPREPSLDPELDALVDTPAPSRSVERAIISPEIAPSQRVQRRDDAAVERRMLDAARRKLLEGKPEDSLQKLQEHARAFPRGLLVEEREAMTINALVGNGSYDAARRRADSFRKAYPHSVLAGSVEAAILAIP